MTLRGEGHPDELISASLTGDLTGEERATLDAHLAGCGPCRATLDAFSRERSLLGELRRSAPPADLGARVRAGIESGRGLVPWWRRPSTLVGTVATLATVAAALLAVVILGSIPRGPVGATGSPSASPSAADSTQPTASIAVASEGPSPTAGESTIPLPTLGPDPVGMLEYRVQDQEPSIAISTDEGAQPVEVERYGLPINAVLAPGGEWVAFQIKGDLSELVDTYAYRLSDGMLVSLFQGSADTPFQHLAWSADGTLLAFTGLSADAQRADVWVFNTTHPDAGARQLTDTGRSFAADFYGASGDVWLWVSTAAEGDPSTDRLPVPLQRTVDAPLDLGADSLKHIDGAFLPLWDRHPTRPGLVVAWRGRMAIDGGGWHFAQGGMPYLFSAVEGDYELSGDAPAVFETLTIGTGGQAFRSARYAWSPDGESLAVWDARWEGTPQPEGFPDPNRVYFCHPGEDVLVGPQQALDDADTSGGLVIDVSLAGGQYLALTVQTAPGSESGTYGPTAELRIVTRNTGDVADDVATVADPGAWIGPAFYHNSVAPD